MAAKYHGISFVGEGMGRLYYVVLAGLELKASPALISLSWLFLNLHIRIILLWQYYPHTRVKPNLG